MSSQSSGVVLLALFSLMPCVGCINPARQISMDANSGVVAIPCNSNEWPTHYRKHAEELMRDQFPQGYVIDRQEEAVVGTTQLVTTNTNRTGDPLLAALRIAPVVEEKTEASSTQDRKEWRIYYHRPDAAPPVLLQPAPN